MFGITWVCESTFANANFMTPKYRSSTSDEKFCLASEFRCAVSIKYTQDLNDLGGKDAQCLNNFRAEIIKSGSTVSNKYFIRINCTFFALNLLNEATRKL